MIDDFSEGMGNHSFHSPVKGIFDTLDNLVVLAKAILEAVKDDGSVSSNLPSGRLYMASSTHR